MPALFVLLWATGFIGAKFGMPYAPPLKFLLWRYLAVIVLMGALSLATRAPWPRGMKIAHVAIAGMLLQAGYLGGVFIAIDLGSQLKVLTSNQFIGMVLNDDFEWGWRNEILVKVQQP